MSAAEVRQFLSMLAKERRVSSSTHNQALSALLFCLQLRVRDLNFDRGCSTPHQARTVHTLRHSFARHRLQSGMDIRTVQELLGTRT